MAKQDEFQALIDHYHAIIHQNHDDSVSITDRSEVVMLKQQVEVFIRRLSID